MDHPGDDDKPMTFRRALRMPEYWLLLVTALAGCLGVAWWIAVPLATAGLSISSLPKYVELWPRVRAVGAEWEGWKTVALSMFNNIAGAASRSCWACCRGGCGLDEVVGGQGQLTKRWGRVVVSAMEIALEKNKRSDPTFTVFLVLAFIFLFSLMYAVWPVPPAH